MNLVAYLSTNKIITLAHSGKRFPHHWTYPIGASLFSLLTPYLSSLCILPYYIFIAWRDPEYTYRLATDLTFDGLIGFLGIFIFVAGWLWIFERRGVASTGFIRENILTKYLHGLAIGILIIIIVILLISASENNIITSHISNNYTTLLRGSGLLLIGFVIQGAAEEVLARGFVLPVVGARFGVVWGILISSAIFSLLHLLNPNLQIMAIINLFIFGIFAALYALWEGSLWGICGLHTAWNWVLGSFFGAPVSGLHVQPSWLQYTPGSSALWDGGSFGPEGGLAVSLVLLSGIIIILWGLVQKARKENAPTTSNQNPL